MNPSTDDDELILRLVKNLQEDREVEVSARRLHERFSPLVKRFFTRRRVPSSLTEELTQDTFLRVFQAIEEFRSESQSSFSIWTFKIARNIFNNWLRTIRTQKRDAWEISLDSQEEREDQKISPIMVLALEEPSALDQLTEGEQRAVLHEEIRKLSAQRRRCCELRYLGSLKYREIAVILNLSIDTVKAHLHQARAALEEAIEAAGWKRPAVKNGRI